MENFKRITPEEIISAYLATEILPSRITFLAKVENTGEWCGCGLGAKMLKDEKAKDKETFLWGLRMSDWADRQGYEFPYLYGFMAGFDGLAETWMDEARGEIGNTGFMDGKAAREAVMEKLKGVNLQYL